MKCFILLIYSLLNILPTVVYFFSVPIYKTICRWKTLQLLTKNILRDSFYHLSYIQVLWHVESYWQALSHNVISSGIKVKCVIVIGDCWLKDNTYRASNLNAVFPGFLFCVVSCLCCSMFVQCIYPDLNCTQTYLWKCARSERCIVKLVLFYYFF